MNIYLAGPVLRAEDHGVGWREDVKEMDQFDEIEWLDPIEENGFSEAQEMDPDEVVQSDKGLIEAADALLVGFTEVFSIGTWREVEWALSVRQIPVAIWTEPEGELEKPLSPWMEEAGIISESIEKCIGYLEEKAEESPNARLARVDKRSAFLLMDALEQMLVNSVKAREMEIAAEVTSTLFLLQSQFPKWTNEYFSVVSDHETMEEVIAAMTYVEDWAEKKDHQVVEWFGEVDRYD